MSARSLPFWLTAAFTVALTLAAATLMMAHGALDHRLSQALAVTGRWSFALFWLAYTGPLLSRSLARAGKQFGLAYAAAHLVHLGLVIELFQVAPNPPEPWYLILFFSGGVIFTYLLAALSWAPVAYIFGRVVRPVRTIGMHYILLAFAYDFLVTPVFYRPYDAHHIVEYAPFGLAVIIAPLMRGYQTFRAQRRNP